MKYRVWLKDIALQDIEVEANSPQEARKFAKAQIAEGDIEFNPVELEQSSWEVESIEQITE